MKTSDATSRHMPLLLATALSAGLVLSGCNNKDDTTIINKNETTIEADADISADEATMATTAVTDNSMVSDSQVINGLLNPTLANAEQPSLVTNPTEPGTPEDTVKQALNTLYYGDVEDAVGYYRVDMEDFETELANTQSAFQQTVESVTITNTQYSVDRIRATITGELKLKGQGEPAPLTYQLRKVGSEWKIVG